MRENRETVLVLEGRAAGKYYGRVFEADWSGPGLPAGFLVAVVLASAGAAWVARRLEFDSGGEPPP